MIAPGAIERPQFMAGLLRLYAEKQRRRSAFGAVRARDRIGVRGGGLVGGHDTALRYRRERDSPQSPTPDTGSSRRCQSVRF